ncbi:NAD(P)/FAD-dependent oxidoreductase [Candidatus Chloroploca sp. M-50]|uniref:NAD(P)/FAD-dependent oxidoreductase n=1 Tax=Candidatus Chloroploca mongolica TaxID=2528176 RepID=A0ABS4D415_9CHLR|nr:NAD(P)/FAD-dependent oxidoreductase [Candidatus Chloroploca mongolica]MBP1464177.1 NAD(P)/FAD-dependent oxidoreductase [Candidatus Chloroploca mongolica]
MYDQFHTIVIGAGSGGLTVAVGLSSLGKSVAVLEALHVGGDCTNVGCVPSKTLIHQAEERGTLDPDGVLAEVRRKRDALREKETHEFGEIPNLSLIFGRARLVSRTQVAVRLAEGGERMLQAENIVIATGARPRKLVIPGLPEQRMLTNETVFELPVVPHHLAIIGGGVIGVELAFAFRKLGSHVSMIDSSPRLLTRHLPEAAEAIEASLAAKGVELHFKTSVQGYDEAMQALQIERNGKIATLHEVDYVLVAVGRQRNLDGLGLEDVGITFDLRNGIAADSYGRTNVPGIYAIGDVTTTSAFTHSANAQGRRVVQRIAFPWLPATTPEPFYPSATFADPEVATAGMSQRDLATRYHPALIKRIRVDLVTQTDRGYTDDLQHGFIIVDTVRLTGKILSVTIVGPRASEMISLFTLAIQEGISLYRLYRVVYPYPTFSSGIQKVADAFMRETLPNLRGELATYLRYRWARPARVADVTVPVGARAAERTMLPGE